MIAAINKVLSLHHLGTARPGRIEIVGQEQLLLSAEKAMQEFLAFGGEGWLCTAGSKAILRLILDGFRPPAETTWPLQGELVDGDRSRHLRRTPQGWSVITFKETASTSDDDSGVCLIDTELHSHLKESGLRLRYTVAWTPETIGDGEGAHAELRPTKYRFAGFVGADESTS